LCLCVFVVTRRAVLREKFSDLDIKRLKDLTFHVIHQMRVSPLSQIASIS